MTQALYAHMNNKTIKNYNALKKIRVESPQVNTGILNKMLFIAENILQHGERATFFQ
jgi:hypothetical protein